MFTDLRVPRFGKAVETSCSRLPQPVSFPLGARSLEIVPSEPYRVPMSSGSSDFDLGFGFWVRYLGRLATHWLKLMWEDVQKGRLMGIGRGQWP